MEQGERKFHLIKTKIMAYQRLFEDPDFPTIDSMISPKKKQIIPCSWVRPLMLYENLKFIDFERKEQPEQTGILDKMGIGAAIQCIALNPPLFFRTVPVQENTGDYFGIYLFRFWRDGSWISVYVDDRVPFRTDLQNFIFTSQGLPIESWKVLLEKAYAKLNGSYWALTKINMLQMLEEFTGGLCEYFNLQGYLARDLVAILNLTLQKRSLAIISSSEKNDFMRVPNVEGINYCLIKKVRTFLYKDREISCLKLRRLWGNIDESNDAADKDPEAKHFVLKSMNEILQLEVIPSEFWITLKDFDICFDHLFICNLAHDLYLNHTHWEMSFFEGTWLPNLSAGGPPKNLETFATNPQFRLEIHGYEHTNTPVVIGLLQKPVIINDEKQDLLGIGLNIFKVNVNQSQHLDLKFFQLNDPIYKGNYFSIKQITARMSIPPGNYVIIPSTASKNQYSEFILRVYTLLPTFMDIPQTNEEIIAKDYIISKQINTLQMLVPQCYVQLFSEQKPMVGKLLEFTIQVTASDTTVECPVCMYMVLQSMRTNSTDYKMLKAKEETIFLLRGRSTEVKFNIEFHEYARKNIHEVIFTIICTTFTQGGKALFSQNREFCFGLPEIFIEAPFNNGKFSVESWFVNPTPYTIELGLYSINCDLFEKPSTLHIEMIGPMARAVTTFDIIPHQIGTYSITVRFLSKLFNLATCLEIQVQPPPKSIEEGEEEGTEEGVDEEITQSEAQLLASKSITWQDITNRSDVFSKISTVKAVLKLPSTSKIITPQISNKSFVPPAASVTSMSVHIQPLGK